MRVDELVGKQLGEFQVVERIGRGGMATVYRALQPGMNRDVALKVLQLDDALEDESFRKRFAQEAEVIASLEHIHILPVYTYGIVDNVAYLAMRLLRGGSLADLMKHGTLPLERTVDLFTQIAQGLAYAHSKGVVHRDLKPTNILLDEMGHPYLTDFGLAKLMTGDANMTKTGNIVGTPSYMSPEQLRGEPLDQRSDVYSLGIILYQMLTGRKPFEGDSSDIVSMIYKHLEKAPTPPSAHNPAILPEVETIVLRALAKDPDDRYDSVGDMAADLQAATGIRSSSHFAAPSRDLTSTRTTIKKRRTSSRPPMIFWLAGGAVVAFVVIILLAARAVLPTLNTRIFTPPTIMDNQKATIEETTPSDEEVRFAQQVLGDNGFMAILPCNLESEYHATVTREMTDFAREYGIKTQVYDAQGDAYTQSTRIEAARLEGAAGFIICPLDSSLDSALTSLDEANIPLVLPATGDTDKSYGGVIINTDNRLLGLIPGQSASAYIRDELGGQAQVIILDYPDLEYLVQRANGLEEGVKHYTPNVTIVGRYRGGTREFGEQSVTQLLEDGIMFNVILSINDAGAYGAIAAMEKAGIDPASVAIFSVDAEQLAQEHIRNDYFIHGSVATARTKYAQAAINMLVRQLAGSTIPELIVLAPGEMVTKKSLEG